MIIVGPKKANVDQIAVLPSPNKDVVEAGLSVAGLKKAFVGLKEGDAGGKNIPRPLKQGKQETCQHQNT